MSDFIVRANKDASTFEKAVLLPQPHSKNLLTHTWVDACFALDIMQEHALFFTLLMPPEVAGPERDKAMKFYDEFTALKALPMPEKGETRAYTEKVIEAIKPFIEYKHNCGDAQRSGTLRSLVWPLFFDHTQHEAERWVRRLKQLGKGYTEYDLSEVESFWTNIMDEHAEFIAHLLDPDETSLIMTANRFHTRFLTMHGRLDGLRVGRSMRVVVSNSNETLNIEKAANEILNFKTAAVRGIEVGRIKSIIDPRLADHLRRETVKFIDELTRAV